MVLLRIVLVPHCAFPRPKFYSTLVDGPEGFGEREKLELCSAKDNELFGVRYLTISRRVLRSPGMLTCVSANSMSLTGGSCGHVGNAPDQLL